MHLWCKFEHPTSYRQRGIDSAMVTKTARLFLWKSLRDKNGSSLFCITAALGWKWHRKLTEQQLWLKNDSTSSQRHQSSPKGVLLQRHTVSKLKLTFKHKWQAHITVITTLQAGIKINICHLENIRLKFVLKRKHDPLFVFVRIRRIFLP